MAFPTVATRASSQTSANVSSHTVSLPTGIQAGDLLLACLGFDNSGATPITWPSGWTKIADLTSGNTTFSVAWCKATGSEGTSISVTSSVACRSGHSVLRITGARDPTIQAPQIATATGSSATPNPPLLTPTGGTKDYLWIAAAEARNNITAGPTNYANLNGGFDTVACKTAERSLTTSSEDPGTFTAATSVNWAAATIAVYPAVIGSEFPASTSTSADQLADLQTYLESLGSISTTQDAVSAFQIYAEFPASTSTSQDALLDTKFLVPETISSVSISVSTLTDIVALTLASTSAIVDSLRDVQIYREALANVGVVVDEEADVLVLLVVSETFESAVGIWYESRQQYWLKLSPTDMVFYVLSRREIVAENPFTGARSRVQTPWVRFTPIPGAVLSVWSSEEDDGRILAASGSDIRQLDVGASDLGSPYSMILETAPIAFDTPGEQRLQKSGRRSRVEDPRPGLLRDGHVRRVRVQHRAMVPLSGLVRYLDGETAPFTVGDTSDGDKLSVAVIEDRANYAQFASIRLEASAATPAIEITAIDVEARLRASHVWR